MITRNEFPYLKELLINDAYAVKNLRVPVFESGQKFKHLVLTGRNGSGKTTVLRAIMEVIRHDSSKPDSASQLVSKLRNWISSGNRSLDDTIFFQKELDRLSKVTITYSNNNTAAEVLLKIQLQIITTFFEATRKVQVREVSTISREDELNAQLQQSQHNQHPAELFKQYLVNKKVFQVFDTMEGKQEGAKQQEQFFTNLEATLAKIFEDPGIKLEFARESFEFYINLSDGRRFTFNQLSAGFSAFLSVLTELLMRTDLLRKQTNDYTYEPCGFVLIDEPETHLHLEMQYQILPLLTGLFPNLQFIVATHSPAVASSITNATVFDLSTGKLLGDSAAGSSFSELMQTHFGLENEYSNVADQILNEVAKIGQLTDRIAAHERLQRLLDEQGRYMSPVLLDVQAHLFNLQREQAA